MNSRIKSETIKLDDSYLKDEESIKNRRLNESLNCDESLSENIGISVEDARKILIARLKKIAARHRNYNKKHVRSLIIEDKHVNEP